MSSALSIQKAHVPLVDVKTGLVTREWYRTFQELGVRAGGPTGDGTGDVAADLTDLAAAVNALVDEVAALTEALAANVAATADANALAATARRPLDDRRLVDAVIYGVFQ